MKLSKRNSGDLRKPRRSQILLSVTTMNKRKWVQTATWEIPFTQKMTQEKEEEKNDIFYSVDGEALGQAAQR